MESKEPLATQDIVKAMSEKGYWKSPSGKTPHATIYAAMAREITEKGKASRFKKVDRGMFTAMRSESSKLSRRWTLTLELGTWQGVVVAVAFLAPYRGRWFNGHRAIKRVRV